MSQILKDAESLHTDQHDANVISPVFSSIDKAGQKNDKATFSTSKQDKRHMSKKRKRNSPSASPEIVKLCIKKRRKKSRSKNGRSALSEIPSETVQFAMKNKFQGSIFFSFP